jgi:hypothetical protein
VRDLKESITTSGFHAIRWVLPHLAALGGHGGWNDRANDKHGLPMRRASES